MKDRKGEDLDGRGSGRELEGSEGEEIVIRMSYVKGNIYFHYKRINSVVPSIEYAGIMEYQQEKG